jgi:hypothetical protein
MKSLYIHSVCFSLLMMTLCAHAQSGIVTLYEKPDVRAPVVAKAGLKDPRLSEASPVFDEARAALGWQVASFEIETTGYVADSSIGKDLLPVENALVRTAPRETAPVLGTVVADASMEVLDNGPFWEVRLTVARPVYFLPPDPPALPPVTAPAPAEAASATTEPMEESRGPAPVSPVITEDPVVDRTAAPATGVTATAPATPAAEETDPTASSLAIGQSFEGIFTRTSRFMGLFKPPYAFAIENANGRRIAYVDVSEIVIPGSLKGYLDQRVIVYGPRQQHDDSDDWVILARNMRLK